MINWFTRTKAWLLGSVATPKVGPPAAQKVSVRVHVIILDGTRSSLIPGSENHAGMAYKLIQDMAGTDLFVTYLPGIQFSTDTWTSMFDVLTGRGINNQIRKAYGALASRYRPGDQIFLMGYSRGAYAARSLAGIIDRIGLLEREYATYRLVRQAFRHYKNDPDTAVAQAFSDAYCHSQTCVAAIGVWDTVKALGVRLPLIWRAFDGQYKFHNHRIAACVQHGYHALVLDETRKTYAPVMWYTRLDWPGHMEQMWFRGNHSDIGGQFFGRPTNRGLSNIPFVWMMQSLQHAGLPLPSDWQDGFLQVPAAKSVGNWVGLQKLFLVRSRRPVGRDPSERVHTSVVPSQHRNLADFQDSTGTKVSSVIDRKP